MQDKEFEKKAIVFLAKFFAIYAVLQFLILAAPIQGLQQSIAWLEGNAFGLETEGSLILFNGHSFEIVANCTGLVGISVLAAIVFALRKPEFKKKAMLFGLGALILFPLNLLRVYLVLLAATSFNPDAAEALHVATWFTTSAAILLLWYYLTKKVALVKEFGSLI